MARHEPFTVDSKGKRVVDTDGEEVGRVVDVEDGVAYVDPDASIAKTIVSNLGLRDDRDRDLVELEPERVGAMTSDVVRLSR